ncbi:transporter, DASS family [Veillonella atypica ACS-049-V-Sch6]|uniref:Transporter, DASS family n=1 Tax=Veillonella atypica ACS-049-V-Sch6 TaxID=866776 RepID=E1L814_9FIRM|nr:DASS family sodium-coupled anion symporter [Veillonella atypica]EFL55491.1 transporter, DASS family [Veillonella atypica ACS-049-V-Sch6]
MERLVKLAVIVLIPIILWFTTPPAGLSAEAWRLFGFYIAGILGLILKPYPIQIILLSVLAASALFMDNAKDILVGYGSTALWMIIAAFSLSVAFGKTGLGHRVAYHLIRAFGSTVLRLGYVTALLDLILSPATPSNTARAAGIVYPINLSIAESIGSYPGDTAKRGGSFILMNGYFVTKITSFMFLTAMAPNVLALDFVTKITGLTMNWVEWAVALALPGLVMLFFVPLVGYWIDRPEAVKIDNKKLADDGLAKLGPMKMSEKILAVVFILALIGWALPSIGFDLSPTAVALVAMTVVFLAGIITWDDMVQTKAVWNTFIWFGAILGLSTALTKAKFFAWLATFMQTNLALDVSPLVVVLILSAISVVIRYLFASSTAYIASMLPVFLTVGMAAGVNPVMFGLVLLATNAFGGLVTHYGASPGPIIYSAGYNNLKEWWTAGGILAILSWILLFVVGIPWWTFIGMI